MGFIMHILAMLAIALAHILVSADIHQYEPLLREYLQLKRSGKFSEEWGGNSGLQSGLTAGITCHGWLCDEKTLLVYENQYDPIVECSGGVESQWANGGKKAVCPPDMVMNRMFCTGMYCQYIKLGCGKLKPGFVANPNEIVRTDSFSQEQGMGQCPDAHYVQSVECQGLRCDKLILFCVKVLISPTVCKALQDHSTHLRMLPSVAHIQGGSTAPGTEVYQKHPIIGIECSGVEGCTKMDAVSISNGITPATVDKLTYWAKPFGCTDCNEFNCKEGHLAVRISCGGSGCSEPLVACAALQQGFIVDDSSGFYMESDPRDGIMLCPAGFAMNGLKCEGDNCMVKVIRCVSLQCELPTPQ